jgi:hypothetical protein
VLGWSFKLNGEAVELDYKTILGLAHQLQSRKHNYKTILCIVLLPSLSIAIVVSAVLAKIHIKRRLQARENELEWEREYGGLHPSPIKIYWLPPAGSAMSTKECFPTPNMQLL